MRAAIWSKLTGDATFMSYLAGGLYNSWDDDEIDRVLTPDAFDENKELLPTGYVKAENDSSFPTALAREVKVSRFIFSLMFYALKGTDATPIYNALDRAFALLEGWQPATAWITEHADDVLDQEDEALGAKMLLSRYVILRRRS